MAVQRAGSGKRKTMQQLYLDYITGTSWVCGESPSGAHHWLHEQGNLFRCIHCNDERTWPLTWTDQWKGVCRKLGVSEKQYPIIPAAGDRMPFS